MEQYRSTVQYYLDFSLHHCSIDRVNVTMYTYVQVVFTNK